MVRERVRIQQHRAAVVDALRKRLEQRELQLAQFGTEAPPLIAIEIEDLRAQIEELSPEHTSAIDPSTAEDLGPIGRYQLLMSHIQTLYAADYRIERAVEKLDRHVRYLIYAIIASGALIVVALKVL